MQGFPRSLGSRPALALVLLGALSACRTIEIRRPIHATGEVRVGMPARAWEVVHEGAEAVGMVVLFEGREPGESIYVVRNVWQQDLGIVDNLGRAYRYEPHHETPAWVGSGTVQQGVERILGRTDCRLFEVPFRELDPVQTPGELQQRRADRPESGQAPA